MEKKVWEITGMTCASCTLSITKILEKNGAKNIHINAISNKATFYIAKNIHLQPIIKQIENLGYKVSISQVIKNSSTQQKYTKKLGTGILLLVSVILTIPLFIGHFAHIEVLHSDFLNVGLCIPVYLIGFFTLGKSAWKSILAGAPNMNMLIMLGATSAFVYSLTGSIFHLEGYMFYETTSSIITIVLIGNYIEERTISSTQKAIKTLIQAQVSMANMITFDDKYQEIILPIEVHLLRVGDIILVREGDKIPTDCKVLSGEAKVNESLLTGESLSIEKNKKDTLIGGSIVEQGNLKAQVTAVGSDTILASIIRMMEDAQNAKPALQTLADKISTIFIPLVLGISLLTLIINYFVLEAFSPALLRSIAVLVIACPCALGLATPAAIAVGLGRATRKGILFRNAKGLEYFKKIQRIVFDKTGTLTTGSFAITQFHVQHMGKNEFKAIAVGLEKYSSHPLAQSILQAWNSIPAFSFVKVEELKAMGMQGQDNHGNIYKIGSFRLLKDITEKVDENHSLYILKNNQLIGWIDVEDSIKEDAQELITLLHSKKIETILLSGDRKSICEKVAIQLGIQKVFAECLPKDKQDIIAHLNQEKPTAMVGDGINDAPALSKATIGISVSKASQIAIQAAQVVLVNNQLNSIYESIVLGKYTQRTIIRNFIWAFSYNIIAIPIAAVGLLTPTFGALVMGMSDIFLFLSSSYLAIQKIK
ncbi:MAG: heavy metal translocating P-type ATPase [Chitinophagaceae bacterium]